MTRTQLFSSTALLVAAFGLTTLAYADDRAVAGAQSASSATVSGTSDEPQSRFTLIGGAQYRNDVDRLGRARFEEFRDVPQGGALEFLRFVHAPFGKAWSLSFTARDAFQDDQRYLLDVSCPAKLRLRASYSELPRYYSAVAQPLWSGLGTGNLTLSQGFREGAEAAAGAPNAPFASADLQSYMRSALAGTPQVDIRNQRKDLAGGLEFRLAPALTLSVSARQEWRDGTRPLGFGTYIRRQALAGVPGTGANSFWRETIEARGSELVEPVDYRTSEGGVTLTWVKGAHSLSAGWFGSRFRNDASALYFDNPFEAAPGRSSASVFDPKSDQEPASPLGNNLLRGLTARSVMQLWPENDYRRLFANGSLRVGPVTRLSAVVARGTMKQDQPFLPYAENPEVVFSQAGQPLVSAKDAVLPQSSLNGKMNTTQADLKLTSKLGPVSARAGYRYYELDDERPSILFPGYSSSGDAYFRPSIGQKDASGNRILFNEVGGYTRQRASLGAGARLGRVTADLEYVRTGWDYDARQVDQTTEGSLRATLRAAVGLANVEAFYRIARRDFEGGYQVGLETSGVRAFDVWKRDRDQVGFDVDLPLRDTLTAAFGASYWKDEYPGAVEKFAYGYGLQDSSNGSYYLGTTYAKNDWLAGGWIGIDSYQWESLQVTKTSLGADYNPTNRWSRSSADDVFWIGLEGAAPLTKSVRVHGDLNYQRFKGDWGTANLATPDINSAVAYPFPQSSDSTLSARASLLWDFSKRVGFEARYAVEPYRLSDLTWDLVRPYMQGAFQETRSSPSDVGDMNVSRFLFLNSRYGDYTAHVLSAFVHVKF